MQAQQVHTLVRDFVQDLHPGEPERQIPAEATFEAVGIDSMSLVDLLFKLEREFGVAIPDESLPDIATVGDLVEFVTTESH
jgi:acyl carrier protein